MSVLVPTGVQTGWARSAQASTTMTNPLDPVTVKPNWPACTPKLASLVCTKGFHRTVGRSPNAEFQPVVPGKK